MEECYCGRSFTARKLGCRRQHNALAHDELSERIISATPVSVRGWAPLCCTKPRRRSGREAEKGRETQRGNREREESVITPGGFFQSTDVGTLFWAGPGAESVCQQHALSPLCSRHLCQEWGPAYEVRWVGPSFKSGLAFVEQPGLLLCLDRMLWWDALFPAEAFSGFSHAVTVWLKMMVVLLWCPCMFFLSWNPSDHIFTFHEFSYICLFVSLFLDKNDYIEKWCFIWHSIGREKSIPDTVLCFLILFLFTWKFHNPLFICIKYK